MALVDDGEVGNVQPKKRWTWRWLLALAAITLLALSLAFDWWGSQCSEELAQTGDDAVVEVCRAPSLSDPAVLLTTGLILLLLWPDLSEVSLGLISLKRRIDENQERTESRLTELKQQIVAMSVRQTVTVRNEYGRGDLNAEEVRRGAEAIRKRALEPGQPADHPLEQEGQAADKWKDAAPPGDSQVEPVEPILEDPVVAAFLTEWGVIEGVIDARQNLDSEQWLLGSWEIDPRVTPPKVLNTELKSSLDVKYAIGLIDVVLAQHKDTLDAARSARNLIVHQGVEIDGQSLRSLTVSLMDISKTISNRLRFMRR